MPFNSQIALNGVALPLDKILLMWLICDFFSFYVKSGEILISVPKMNILYMLIQGGNHNIQKLELV